MSARLRILGFTIGMLLAWAITLTVIVFSVPTIRDPLLRFITNRDEDSSSSGSVLSPKEKRALYDQMEAHSKATSTLSQAEKEELLNSMQGKQKTEEKKSVLSPEEKQQLLESMKKRNN